MRATTLGRCAAAALVLAIATGAGAQHQMYRCGATYQDRPCADGSTQRHYSHAAGRFERPRQAQADGAAPTAAPAARSAR